MLQSIRSARAGSLLLLVTLTSAAFAAWAGCAPAAPGPSEAPVSSASAAPSVSTDAPARADGGLGGRIFDKWYEGTSFKPDDAKTPDRLKNLFGWDLRGADGIYGPKYQKKKNVLPINLLKVEASREDLIVWLTSGHEGIPAYGEVLDAAKIAELADFIVAMREGKIARPEQVFDLSETAPGNYTLRSGGDPARGARLVRERCASCHGHDGTQFLFDGGEFSLGSHARQKAYEDWMKILNGQPGTAMGRQVEGTNGPAMAQEILDILAALCDRAAFPKGKATAADVSDGDLRCGSYLR
ncbi:MAG: hypothetical protein HOW73_24265 [Polyangiaceae bacterium]|nr:hypothetical protein [Polyangiaceae bacterium]